MKVISLCMFMSFLTLQGKGENFAYAESNEELLKNNILDKHRFCKISEDCVLFSMQCSCDCGEVINKKFVRHYLDRKEKACRGYLGKMCKIKCPESFSCIEGLCKVNSN